MAMIVEPYASYLLNQTSDSNGDEKMREVKQLYWEQVCSKRLRGALSCFGLLKCYL